MVAKDGEGPGTVLEGFTITGGGGELEPAIDSEFSALTLRDCVVTGNVGLLAVYTRSGRVVLERTRVEGNTPSEGVVMRARRGSLVLKDSVIACGAATVGYSEEHGATLIDGGSFACAGAVAIRSLHAPARITHVVIDGEVVIENEEPGAEGAVIEGSVLRGGARVILSDMTLRNVVATAPIVATRSNLTIEGSIVTGAACGISASGSAVIVQYLPRQAGTPATSRAAGARRASNAGSPRGGLKAQGGRSKFTGG